MIVMMMMLLMSIRIRILLEWFAPMLLNVAAATIEVRAQVLLLLLALMQSL